MDTKIFFGGGVVPCREGGPEQTRVEMAVPSDLVASADALADVLGEPRGSIIVSVLDDKINELVSDEAVQRRPRAAVFAGGLEVDTAAQLLETNAATRLLLLKNELEREIPEPVVE